MLTKDLSSHLALVTGATGGIGSATCLPHPNPTPIPRRPRLPHCPIAVHYHTATTTATTLIHDLRTAYNVRAEAFQADLSAYAGVRQLHQSVLEKMGPPTILSNNAGMTGGAHGVSSIADVSVEMFEETWRTNCGGAFLLTQLCVPGMEGRGWGRVVFLFERGGVYGGSGGTALCVYGPKGILVNGVAPALIKDTKMLPGNPEELAKKIPIGVLGTPEEVAETVLWMVKTGYVTNKIIGVDGGLFPQ